MIRAYPGRGVPPPLRGFDEYLETLEGIRLGGGPEDHTMVWWDARLQPRLGTVELRELDVQTGLEQTAGMAALVHAVARRAAEQPPDELAPAQALHWSSFRAVRDGLDAELLFRGRLRPAREAARELLDELRGSDEALEGVERILSEGGAPGASARCSPRPAWRGCCGRWPTKRVWAPFPGHNPENRAHTNPLVLA